METHLNPEKAKTIVRHYLCSDCWETLIEYWDPKTRKSAVRCATQDCPCRGYIRREFAERRRAESRVELADARIALRSALPRNHEERKSPEQLLRELGY
jgi:hypothetical protein